ncbi:hypothetical protein Ahy_B06g084132 [Arachis hypogaea]|uniref:At2g35280-like TPR domain-containing protein n=1 Tax=Arachis hypogaea TaxID=3818 RepID=A0A444YRA5_ARAHY|nr:hypothetical protein Ahy_B06g084132 [Arachis hypogaea]
MRYNHDIGLEMLYNAASNGRDVTKYALSMMLHFRRDDNEGKRNGIELFCVPDAAGLLTVCKARCFGVLTISWQREVQMPKIKEQHLVYDSPRCLIQGHMGLLYDYRRWVVEQNSIHGFGGATYIPCIYCHTDYELIVFVNLL